MADNRPNRYVENGHVIYRASGLGSCVKSLVALGMGMTPSDHPAWLYEKFQQGIDGEPVVIDMLKSNWRIMDEREGHYYNWDDGQLYVEVPVGQHVTIRGHADGIGTCYKAPVLELGESEWVTGDKRVIEVKCVSEDYARVILDTLPPLYEVQVSVYGGFFKLPVMLALGIKDNDGKVVNVVTQMWDEPPMSMSQVKQRVMFIEQCIAEGELPECSHKQYPCPFQFLCDDVVDAKGRARTKDEDLEDTLRLSIRGADANRN